MSEQPARPGLLEHDLTGVPAEEVRFGVVLNGGVSLAVWMGGVALELDRLVKAPARTDEPYAALLRSTGCTARVDVISGTSAGGVNGAALALCPGEPAGRHGRAARRVGGAGPDRGAAAPAVPRRAELAAQG